VKSTNTLIVEDCTTHALENEDGSSIGQEMGMVLVEHASIHGDQEKALFLDTIPPPVNDVAFEWFSFFYGFSLYCACSVFCFLPQLLQ
jgi:hypothetical protein